MGKLDGDMFSGIKHRARKEINHSWETVPNLREAAKGVIERFVVAVNKRDERIEELEKKVRMFQRIVPGTPATESDWLKLVGERDALKAKLDAVQWQPIETAPRDGTHVDVLFDPSSYDMPRFYTPEIERTNSPRITSVFWDQRRGNWYSAGGLGFSIQPKLTHWRPLPEPPEQEVGDG